MFDVIIPTKCVGGAIDRLCQSIAQFTPYDQVNLWAVGPTQPKVPVAWVKDDGNVASAINAGVAKTTNEFIVILHDDAVLLNQKPAEWISLLHSAVTLDKVGVAGPLKHETHVDFFCAIIPRKVWNDVGPLNAEAHPYRGYDKEWCARAMAKGYSLRGTGDVAPGVDGVFVGSFPIFHKGGTTLDNRPVEVKSSTDVLFTLARKVQPACSVTAHVSTRNRLDSTLPLTLQSISLQSTIPSNLLVFDDNPTRAFYNEVVYQHLFNVLSQRGCSIDIIAGEGRGQVLNHQKAIDRSTTSFLWRVDDDDSAETNVLATLLNVMSTNRAGAVAPLVHFPWSVAGPLGKMASAAIEDVRTMQNVQWCSFVGSTRAEHLHNTFLYRKDAAAHGYPKNLSIVGHREETIFTHEMVLAGWQLYITGDARTWHLREPTGGIRSFKDDSLWAQDEEKFSQWAASRGVKFNNYWLIVLDSGLGDHLAFVHVWPRIKKKAKDEGRKILLAACYPEVFADDPTISIADAGLIEPDLGKHNIYNFMIHKNWTGHIIQAYEAMYGV